MGKPLRINDKTNLNRKEFWKIARYKINTQKSLAFICINNSQLDDIMVKKIPLTIATNKIKYVEVNLTRNVKNKYE